MHFENAADRPMDGPPEVLMDRQTCGGINHLNEVQGGDGVSYFSPAVPISFVCPWLSLPEVWGPPEVCLSLKVTETEAGVSNLELPKSRFRMINCLKSRHTTKTLMRLFPLSESGKLWYGRTMSRKDHYTNIRPWILIWNLLMIKAVT